MPAMTESGGSDVRVVDNSERSRYEIRVGDRLAGFAEYRLRPDRVVLTHTEVEQAFRGRGLAGRLVREALDAARAAGRQVTPLCPYVADYIANHPEYVPLVDDRHRANFTERGGA